MTAIDQKRRRILRQTNRPSLVVGVDLERALSRVRSLRGRGMTLVQMETLTGVNKRSLSRMLSGDATGMFRVNWVRIMSAPMNAEPDGLGLVPATGTVRRLLALWSAGFPMQWLVDESGFANLQHVQKLVGGQYSAVELRNHWAVAELYDRVGEKPPEAFGIDPGLAKWVRGWAAKRQAVPRTCWDPDTIDDPEAFPEWTGACGTARGRRIHAREGIPECQACRDRALDPAEGFQAATFRAMRLERGWSQPQLGDRIGVARESIAGWETGRTNPRETIVPAILEAFQVERGALFKET